MNQPLVMVFASPERETVGYLCSSSSISRKKALTSKYKHSSTIWWGLYHCYTFLHHCTAPYLPHCFIYFGNADCKLDKLNMTED